MIEYVLRMAVKSRTANGNGMLAWREWRATRYFENDEIAFPPTVGSPLSVVIEMLCKARRDAIGGYAHGLGWDPALPMTVFAFEPAYATHSVDGMRCAIMPFEADWRDLLKRLQEAGFTVVIGQPYKNQEPTELPPTEPAE